tara:strand:+ start:33370 stop:33885 length:516 start_codon:yes stop_codon:yes gene_type:complete
MNIDKSKFTASNGKLITQGLFLEIEYNPDKAVFTLKDYDYTYEGKTFYSLKRLYLAAEDVVEYNFATTYLLSWDHWLRMCSNKVLQKHIEEWRTELELKVRSTAVRSIIDMSAEDKGFQAAKFLASRGWQSNPVGRPKKDTSEHDRRVEAAMDREFSEDADRLWEQMNSRD